MTTYTRHGSYTTIYSRHFTQNKTCTRCRQSFQEGEEVVSRNGRKRRVYHRECWETLFI